MSRSVNPELMGCLENLKAEGDRKLSARELAEIIGDVASTLTADLGPTTSITEAPAAGGAPDAMHQVVAAALEALRTIGDPEKEDGRLVDVDSGNSVCFSCFSAAPFWLWYILEEYILEMRGSNRIGEDCVE